MIVRTRAAATLALVAALVAAPVAVAGAESANAATTTTNAFAPVAALDFAPSQLVAFGTDSAYLVGQDAAGALVVAFAASDGTVSRVALPAGVSEGKVFLFEGQPYLMSGTTLYRLSGATATQTTDLGGSPFAVPSTIPGMTLPSTAPLQLTFQKAEGDVLYYLAFQETDPVSPGHYYGVVTYDGTTWKGSMDAANLTDYQFTRLDVLGSTVRIGELYRAYGFEYARDFDGTSWTAAPSGLDHTGSGAKWAYPGVTTAGSAVTYWGHEGAVGDGWRTPDIPLHGKCLATATTCTATSWPISAATEVSNDVVVLGGTDAAFGMTSPVEAGFAVVPTAGATPVDIAGDNGDAVTLMAGAPTGNRVWAVTRTGTSYSLQSTVIDPSTLGTTPTPTPTPTTTPAPTPTTTTPAPTPTTTKTPKPKPTATKTPKPKPTKATRPPKKPIGGHTYA